MARLEKRDVLQAECLSVTARQILDLVRAGVVCTVLGLRGAAYGCESQKREKKRGAEPHTNRFHLGCSSFPRWSVIPAGPGPRCRSLEASRGKQVVGGAPVLE